MDALIVSCVGSVRRALILRFTSARKHTVDVCIVICVVCGRKAPTMRVTSTSAATVVTSACSPPAVAGALARFGCRDLPRSSTGGRRVSLLRAANLHRTHRLFATGLLPAGGYGAEITGCSPRRSDK